MAAKSKTKTKVKSKTKRKAPARAARKPVAATKSRRSSKSKPSKSKKGPDWRIACTSLGEIRQNIDRLDSAIVPLLCQRLHFVTQAANFKPSVAGVVVQSRVEEIVTRVRAMSKDMKSNPDTLERVYRALIDAFTADEQSHWTKLHTQKRLSEKW